MCFLSFLLSASSFTQSGIHGNSGKYPRLNRIPIVPKPTVLFSNLSDDEQTHKKFKNVVIIGAGWGGLSAAYTLSKSNEKCLKTGKNFKVTMVDAAPRAGGLVRDGFLTKSGKRKAEAGQHGFWDNYYNIFSLLENDLATHLENDVLTGYSEQGQYSPDGLEAIWPVYRNKFPRLPTGLAQALYTRFLKLPVCDRMSAFPLILAFSDFDDSKEAWEKYDSISFHDLCVKLGVSRRCYEEAFEPMILTGLFAPGAECSAAAALGMAYFFVLRSQNSFDVRWCRGNIGDRIFQPWVTAMQEQENPVKFMFSTRVVGFDTVTNSATGKDRIISVQCRNENGDEFALVPDETILAVGAAALDGMVRNSGTLARHAEFRRFANLRGTGCLATRIFLDIHIDVPYSANACWGFDRGVGMTIFDIKKLHGDDAPSTRDTMGSVLEVDYYHAESLLVMDDDSIIEKVKNDIDTIFGDTCAKAKVVDAAIIRLPKAVNWYFPGSYSDMPDARSQAFENVFFVGDLVRTRHGSWSQEKAYVSGVEAANLILNKPRNEGVIALPNDEFHVAAGRSAVSLVKRILGGKDRRSPSVLDSIW